MKPIDALAFLLYAAGIGFCVSVGRTAYRVDAHSVVIVLAALALLFAWLIQRRWRSVMQRKRAAKRRVRLICTNTWPDTH